MSPSKQSMRLFVLSIIFSAQILLSYGSHTLMVGVLHRHRGFKQGHIMKKSSFLLASVFLAASSPSWAIPLSYNTASSNIVNYGNDTLQLAGQSGTVSVNTSTVTSAAIGLAVLDTNYTIPSPPDSPITVVLSFALSLGGVTHTVSQTALFSITDAVDTVTAAASASPMLFGAWSVSLEGWQTISTFPGRITANVIADIKYVPEPATLALFGLGLIGIGLRSRKKA